MALLIGLVEGEVAARRYSFACFHGHEFLLRKDAERPEKLLADTGDHCWGHWIETIGPKRYGWFLRGGRLPICPAHVMVGDVPIRE